MVGGSHSKCVWTHLRRRQQLFVERSTWLVGYLVLVIAFYGSAKDWSVAFFSFILLPFDRQISACEERHVELSTLNGHSTGVSQYFRLVNLSVCGISRRYQKSNCLGHGNIVTTTGKFRVIFVPA